MIRHKKPLNRSITIGCVVFIIILCILLSFANLTLYKKYVYSEYHSYIANILDYTLAHIDGDDLKTCIDTLERSEKYNESLLFMDGIMDHFDQIHYFYAILPLNTNDTENIMSVFSAERYQDRYVDTEGNLYLGWISDDEFDSDTATMFFDILNGDEIVYFEEETEWGIDYTGALPIKDSAGNSVAVLALDIDISFLHGMIIRYATVNICIIAFGGLLFICLFLFWSRRNITVPIKRLEESAVGFVDHSRGQRDVDALVFHAPEMRADNEIKALSDAVVKMTEDMRHYVSDIITAEKKVKTMQELANRDALTGIGNKTAYNREVRHLEIMLKEGVTQIGIAVVDLNYLKKINDTYGHNKGDLAIKNLCHLLCILFNPSSVFRIGGDEFVIILRGNDYENYGPLQEQFQRDLAIMAENELLKPWEKVSAAIGAAFYDKTRDKNVESIFKRADRIMYEQKEEMKALRKD